MIIIITIITIIKLIIIIISLLISFLLLTIVMTHRTSGNIKTIINQKDNKLNGNTPLDLAYEYNKSPIKNDIVALLRKYGGKANCYDKNGNEVEKGKGDLND